MAEESKQKKINQMFVNVNKPRQLLRTPPEDDQNRKKKFCLDEEGKSEEETSNNEILKKILEKMNNLEKKFESFEQRIDRDNEERKRDFNLFKEELAENRKGIENIEKEMELLREKVKIQGEKLMMREKEERRKNIIIKGLKEEEGEGRDTAYTKKEVENFLEEKLGLKDIKIQNTSRIGRKRDNSDRPILVTFPELKEKWKVSDIRNKLKGTNIFIDDDYDYETRQIRRKLFVWAKIIKQEGKRVFVNGDKIKIDGENYELLTRNGEAELVSVDKSKNLIRKQ